jgi:hypothetical protein
MDFFVNDIVFLVNVLLVNYRASNTSSISEQISFCSNVIWAIVFLGKCISKELLSGKCLSGQLYFWANVILGKCLSGQMSFWAIVFLGKCLSGQMSLWANIFWANVFCLSAPGAGFTNFTKFLIRILLSFYLVAQAPRRTLVGLYQHIPTNSVGESGPRMSFWANVFLGK